MKINKVLTKVSVSLFVIVILSFGMSLPKAEAAFGNLHSTQYQYMSQQNLQQMVQLLTQLRELLQQLIQEQGSGTSDSDSELQISTRTATDIEKSEAVLRGYIVDFNRSDYADVWFQYGTRSTSLDNSTSDIRIDDDEDKDFERRVTGLDEYTRYYFRAVGEDDRGNKDYGSILNFRTSQYVSETVPSAYTRSALSIEDDEAEIRGTVYMNDFNNGEVFFIYGEDESQVEDIDDDYDSYSEVDEDGENLQKILVDSDLDGYGSFSRKITGLDSNTEHFFTICVGYEDDGEELVCGSVRSFDTD